MLNKLQLYLDQVDQKVQNALKKDNSIGGAVLSVVYKNMTIWTKGYGLINMSGQYNVKRLMLVLVVHAWLIGNNSVASVHLCNEYIGLHQFHIMAIVWVHV